MGSRMWGSHSRISILKRSDAREFVLCLSRHPPPCLHEDTVRRQLPASQKENLHLDSPSHSGLPGIVLSGSLEMLPLKLEVLKILAE